MGAAGRAAATEEIDFVPHILPCSSAWHSTARHGTALQHKSTMVPCVILRLGKEGDSAPPSDHRNMDANMGQKRDTARFPVVLCNNSGTILTVTTLVGYKKSVWSR